MSEKTSSCIVAGAGIIGACCAFYLQRRGLQVTLIDPEQPGQSTSFGNAGGIAWTTPFPFSYPGAIRKVPGWLLDPAGPMRIRWSQALRVLPWLYRFWRAGTPDRVAEIIRAQMTLMQRAVPDFDDLLAATGTEDLRERRGLIMHYDSARDFADEAWEYRERDRLGLPWKLLGEDELAAMEPAVRLGGGVAVFDPEWQHVTDPGALTARIADAAIRLGAEWIHDRVVAVESDARTAAATCGSGRRVVAGHLVLATGVWSNALLRQLGTSVPLMAKRGYHVMIARPTVTLRHPVMSNSRHVVLTPMRDGLRVAGTAEFAGLDAPPDYARARALLDNGRRMVPELGGEGRTEWMGQRPMLPDSLPVIGPMRSHPRVLCAFGHGHYGLTQGPTTGRIISELALGETPSVDPGPFSVERF
ncbi:MAG: FAD-binding oxidoreductase [Lysobacterales bacterium]|jgi:D-amino-acid dehydrogenase